MKNTDELKRIWNLMEYGVSILTIETLIDNNITLSELNAMNEYDFYIRIGKKKNKLFNDLKKSYLN